MWEGLLLCCLAKMNKFLKKMDSVDNLLLAPFLSTDLFRIYF